MFRTATQIGSAQTGRRTLLLGLAALIALMLAASSLALAPRANAQPIQGGAGAAGCEYNGTVYGTGERVVVFSGAHYDTYYCGEDGYWHLVEHYVITSSHRPVNVAPVTTARP